MELELLFPRSHRNRRAGLQDYLLLWVKLISKAKRYLIILKLNIRALEHFSLGKATVQLIKEVVSLPMEPDSKRMDHTLEVAKRNSTEEEATKGRISLHCEELQTL